MAKTKLTGIYERSDSSGDRMAPGAPRQRIDKWLWFSRWVKTRTLAAHLIEQGFVRIDGKRIEQASKLVGCGNVLTIALEQRVVVIEILGCAERRGPYSEASKLYRVIDESSPK